MVTLRLTNNLRKMLDLDPSEQLEPTTNRLGDWYANLVPTQAGDLIIFLSETTLLSVAIPARESEVLLSLFRLRVVNLLRMIGIPPKAIQNELVHYDRVQFAKTRSRSVLGSLNEFAFQYWVIAEQAEGREALSLSRAEYQLSEMPCKPIGYRFPSDVAKEILRP